jgi:hypothetical protein
VGEKITVEHVEASGTYVLSDGIGPTLPGCAVVVTVNAIEAGDTAQATVTGEHEITVVTYNLGAVPNDHPFSLMVTCP